MKKPAIILYFLCFVTHLFGQSKTTFGVVVKTGNYTFPTKKNVYPSYSNLIKVVDKHQPGMSYVFGVYQKIRFKKRFAVSAELLYRLNDYAYSSESQKRNVLPEYKIYDTDKRQYMQISESSISLPVKIHYHFLKNAGTSVSLGVGMSRIFSTEKVINSHIKYLYDPAKDYDFASAPIRNNFHDFNMLLTMNAALYQRIAENTTLGLEFSLERNRYIRKGEIYEDLISVDCSCNYGYPSQKLPNLQSFAIIFQHNLLR